MRICRGSDELPKVYGFGTAQGLRFGGVGVMKGGKGIVYDVQGASTGFGREFRLQFSMTLTMDSASLSRSWSGKPATFMRLSPTM